jgi:dipeptidase D
MARDADGRRSEARCKDQEIVELRNRRHRDARQAAAVKAVHAGLECGIIGEKYPGMDMVSFGPTMTGVHSPDEKLEIASVPKCYEYVLGVLKAV